jgi:hypothetical protein
MAARSAPSMIPKSGNRFSERSCSINEGHQTVWRTFSAAGLTGVIAGAR